MSQLPPESDAGYKLTHFTDHDCIENIHHPSQAKPGIHPYPDRLYVLTMLSNPLRFRRRYENFWKFEKMVRDGGGILYVAEVALENRHFEITSADNPCHLQLRTPYDAPWFKENGLNLLAQRLPPECQKIGVFDSDIQFARADWAQEICHLLAHYDVLQPFSHAQDLGPDGEPLAGHEISMSFLHQYIEHGIPPHARAFMEDQVIRWNTKGVRVSRGAQPQSSPYSGGAEGWHPGLAWAFRKSAWNTLGGLPDWLPTGSGDWHLANALIGNLMRSVDPRHTLAYRKFCKILQERALELRDNPYGGLGYMKGLILHSYHGSKDNRQYSWRHQFVINMEFDPDLDLIRDYQGLWQLSGRNPKLRDGLRAYAKMRKEDQ
jgi:hypothetical protein